MVLEKEKIKQYAISFIKFIAGVYYVLLMAFIALLIVSQPTLNDIFSIGEDRIATLSEYSSKIKHDIVVDSSLLDENGGITALTKNVIQRVALKRPDWRFNLLLFKPNQALSELASLYNVNFILVNIQYNFVCDIVFNILNVATFGFLKDKLIQLIYYDAIFLDDKCDLFWDPAGGGNVNDFTLPKITTIHDIIPVEHPEFFHQERAEWVKKRNINSIKSSEKFITVSNFSKRKILEQYGINDDFVDVIPIRLADRFHFQVSQEEVDNVMKRYDILPKQYIIFISQYYKSKNFERLIEAFSKFVHENNTANIKLVLVGSTIYSYGEIERFAEQYKTGNNIIFTHVVNNKNLQILLSNALFFIHPSLYEGFGMPIIEAMACGVPVACSNRSSLPEIAGDAALFFDPYNVDEISNAMSTMATNSKLREQLVQKGTERAKQFRKADIMTDDYIKVFEEVMKKRE